jgi:hypothetical protein
VLVPFLISLSPLPQDGHQVHEGRLTLTRRPVHEPNCLSRKIGGRKRAVSITALALYPLLAPRVFEKTT